MKIEGIPAPTFASAEGRKLLPISPMRHKNSAIEITVEDERPQEECGLLSFYAPNGMTSREASMIFTGAQGVQHRGQQGGGFTAHAMDGASFVHKGKGLLKHAFPQDVQDQVSDMGDLRLISIQARYATDGGFEQNNLQPIDITTLNGTHIEFQTNGNFPNKERLAREAGLRYDFDPSDSRVVVDAKLAVDKDTQDQRILDSVLDVDGAASSIININGDTQYTTRDRKGVRPLVLGRIEGELGTIFVTASETKALDLIGVTTERDIRPGEVIRFDADGMTVLEKGDKTQARMCSIEHAYMHHPDSRVNVTSNGASPETWPTTRDNRYEVGRQLGREEKARQIAAKARAERRGESYEEFKPDLAIGIPTSGKPFGEGFAKEMGIPYKQLIVKNPDIETRMFQADDNANNRHAGILEKLQIEFPNGWDWKGKKLVIEDDSFVRGNVATVLTEVLNDLGAEVHWRIGYPQIVNPCHLGVNMKTHEELIAYRNQGDVKKMAEEIGAKSVEFISNIGFVKSIQGDHFEKTSGDIFEANRMCGGCSTGNYPYLKDDAPMLAS